MEKNNELKEYALLSCQNLLKYIQLINQIKFLRNFLLHSIISPFCYLKSVFVSVILFFPFSAALYPHKHLQLSKIFKATETLHLHSSL